MARVSVKFFGRVKEVTGVKGTEISIEEGEMVKMLLNRLSQRFGENPKRRIKFEEPPKGTVMIKTYRNTNFVNVMLEKKFYEQLEEEAKRLETTPDVLIYNLLMLKKLKRGKAR